MMNTVKFDRATLVGYIAGIITGVTYGLNPLFAMPLMNAGAPVENILSSATALGAYSRVLAPCQA